MEKIFKKLIYVLNVFAVIATVSFGAANISYADNAKVEKVATVKREAIGIMGAMDPEIKGYLSVMKNVTEEDYSGLKFYKGQYKGQPIVLVKSGIGMINASIAATLLYERYDVNSIIFSGVAGGLGKDIHVLNLVIGDAFVEYDFDVTVFGYAKGQRAGTKKRDIDADKGLLDLSKTVKADVPVRYGRIVSADKFVVSKEAKENLNKEFGADAVDMESAAVAHVCEQFKLPYLIVRSISDALVDNSHIEFEKLVVPASKNSTDFVLKLIDKMIEKKNK